MRYHVWFLRKQGRKRQKAGDKALSHSRADVAKVDVPGWNQRQFLGPSAQPTLTHLRRAKPGGGVGLGAFAVLAALVAVGKFGEDGPPCPKVP